MFDKIEDPNQMKLLEEIGVKSSTNKNGVVRDHIYGRKNGFHNKVFPEILRHPCNCQVITHGENVSKGHRNKNLEELFRKIKLYDGK